MIVQSPGHFEISVAIPDNYSYTNSIITIQSMDFFIPKHLDANSSDLRHLVFKIKGIEYS